MPETLNDEWAVTSPAEVGFNADRLSELDKFLEQWPKHRIHAVVIARRGKLVFERLYSGEDLRWPDISARFSPGDLHDGGSVGLCRAVTTCP